MEMGHPRVYRMSCALLAWEATAVPHPIQTNRVMAINSAASFLIKGNSYDMVDRYKLCSGLVLPTKWIESDEECHSVFSCACNVCFCQNRDVYSSYDAFFAFLFSRPALTSFSTLFYFQIPCFQIDRHRLRRPLTFSLLQRQKMVENARSSTRTNSFSTFLSTKG